MGAWEKNYLIGIPEFGIPIRFFIPAGGGLQLESPVGIPPSEKRNIWEPTQREF